MSLRSPRFVTSTVLNSAATGSKVVQEGSRGRHVHLVQMALIDGGYAMPKSTKNVAYSPDGIFGKETKEKIQKFQLDHNLTADGKIGRNTMSSLDRTFRGFRHKVTLHYRSMSLTNVAFNRLEINTKKIFGQYAIDIRFGSGISLGLTQEEEQRFSQVDGQCNWNITTGEYSQLHGMGGNVSPNDIKVYFVRRFSDQNLLGCGGHAPGRPACTVAAAGSQWDTAHEVCHVLLTSNFSPVHIGNERNLMHAFSQNKNRIPVLTDRQVRQIRNSICCSAY